MPRPGFTHRAEGHEGEEIRLHPVDGGLVIPASQETQAKVQPGLRAQGSEWPGPGRAERLPEGGHLASDQGLDLCFRAGSVECVVYPGVRLQQGFGVSGRGVGFGFIGYSVFGPAPHPAHTHTLPVPKLGLQVPLDCSSEEEPLAAPGLLRSSPTLVRATPLQLLG